jgi:hypothetical protein
MHSDARVERRAECVCGQVIFILTAVGGNLRFASTEDALTSAYDRPPQKSAAVNALWAAAARPRALAAHEKRCLITDSAANLSSVTRVGEDTARTDDEGPAAEEALRRHRERNRSAAVKACSESMLGSLLWMSGHLRTRMAALCSDGGRIDWMGQCNPTAPTDVWPGALPSRSWHARSRRCNTLAVAGRGTSGSQMRRMPYGVACGRGRSRRRSYGCNCRRSSCRSPRSSCPSPRHRRRGRGGANRSTRA